MEHPTPGKPLKLPRSAYEPREGEQFVPLTHGQSLTEFTLKAIATGVILGALFGGANTYLGLKAGLTISTSIPVAVLSVVAFRLISLLGVRYSILELNMSQTVGSASSSVASGVLFTIPALFMWNAPPAWVQMTLLAMCGGLLGVLAMIPLRAYLIDREHGNLPYPEGMACAEVLVASEQGGRGAWGVFSGIGFGVVVKILVSGLKLGETFQIGHAGTRIAVAVKASPALIGVGYILGPRISTIMVAGGALSSFIIIPVIAWWGSGLETPLYPEPAEGGMLLRDMPAGDIWNRYVRYIGAGAVATGGFLTLIRSLPTMVHSFRLGLQNLSNRGEGKVEVARTHRDMPFQIVGLLFTGILLILALVPGILGQLDQLAARGLAALLIGVFAFFFVTVSSRIVGLVGVTSNPTSGMTIAALLGTSLVFYLAGWTDMAGKATALMVGTAVCIAASIAGDTSQDLKTGFVLGATPWKQQVGELIGVITSAGVVCLVILILSKGTGGFGSEELPAPQATLMKLVVDGVIDQNLPWGLIAIGVGIALVTAALGVPVLPFAVGVYLPLSTMAAVFLGGMLRYFLTRRGGDRAEQRRESGVLVGSGFVGGEGLTGVLLAMWVVTVGGGEAISGIKGLGIPWPDWLANLFALAMVGFIVLFLGFLAVRGARSVPTAGSE